MEKKNWARGFSSYWGLSDSELQKLEENYQRELASVTTALESSDLSPAKRKELAGKLHEMGKEYSKIHWMVYMTACTSAILEKDAAAAHKAPAVSRV